MSNQKHKRHNYVRLIEIEADIFACKYLLQKYNDLINHMSGNEDFESLQRSAIVRYLLDDIADKEQQLKARQSVYQCHND